MAEPTATPATLRECLKAVPDQPGVYLFRDASGGLLYVGKAASLKKRVCSYFNVGMLRPDGPEPAQQGAEPDRPRRRGAEAARSTPPRCPATDGSRGVLDPERVQGAADLAPRIARLVELVRRIEIRTTASEAEALLLESQLIKECRP